MIIPKMEPEIRIKLAKELIVNSEKELNRWVDTGNMEAKVQACDKGWGAFAHALKYIDKDIKFHDDFKKVAEKIAKRKPMIRGVFSCASNLHSLGYYEGFGVEKGIRNCLNAIKGFVKEVEEGKI